MSTDVLHSTRRMFAYHNGCLHVAPIGDLRSHDEWFEEMRFKIETTTRGFVREGLICLYRGKDFSVPDDYKQVLRAASHLARNYRVGLGMEIGVPGVEWKPMIEFANAQEAIDA